MVERRLSASLLRIRRLAPFFATLALYARFEESTEVPTAATDGRSVFYNAQFLDSLTDQYLDAVLVHEVLHAALGHVTRRGARDPELWNIAADIVVNGMLTSSGFELPEGAVVDGRLQDFSVEEVYVLLQRDGKPDGLPQQASDLLDPATDAGSGGATPGDATQTGEGPGASGDAEKHWRRAISEASAVAKSSAFGDLPAGASRHFQLSDYPSLDWRSVLWRFLSPTPTDFAAFDRRLLHRGLYVETLEAESLRIAVCVDASGSIDELAVGQLLAEVDDILRAYPDLTCDLYYADAAVYGPHRISPGTPPPPPQGGGGTDFRPFFEAVTADGVGHPVPSVAVYLTDGYGSFPDDPPGIEVLWAVTAGGLDEDAFPFGTVVRLAAS